jgi:hypothetical protein
MRSNNLAEARVTPHAASTRYVDAIAVHPVAASLPATGVPSWEREAGDALGPAAVKGKSVGSGTDVNGKPCLAEYRFRTMKPTPSHALPGRLHHSSSRWLTVSLETRHQPTFRRNQETVMANQRAVDSECL